MRVAFYVSDSELEKINIKKYPGIELKFYHSTATIGAGIFYTVEVVAGKVLKSETVHGAEVFKLEKLERICIVVEKDLDAE